MTTPGEKTSQMALYSTLTPAVLTDLLCIDRPNGDSYKSPLAAFRTLLLGSNASWAADPLAVTGHSAFGANAAISALHTVQITETMTGGNVSGVRTTITHTPSVGSWNANGGYFALSSSTSQNGTALRGLYAGAYYSGAGTLGGMMGVLGEISFDGLGTVAAADGFQAYLENVGAGIITTAAGFRVNAVVNLGAGSITNAYGLLIAAISAGATLNYAIKTLGGRIGFVGLPTSASGLATGDLWNNAGVLSVA